MTNNKFTKLLVSALLACATVGYAAQLTTERDTPSQQNKQMVIGVDTNTIIYAGSMVAVDANGYATNGLNVSGYIIIGRAAATAKNRTTDSSGGATGAVLVTVDHGTFGWKNAGDITKANIGSMAYVVDDQTVSVATNGNNVIVGCVADVDANYVWIDTFNIPRTAGSFTTLSASGASTLSGPITAANIAISGGTTTATARVLGPFTAGSVTTTSLVTFASASCTTAAEAAPTNAAGFGFQITINGTNYHVAASKANGT